MNLYCRANAAKDIYANMILASEDNIWNHFFIYIYVAITSAIAAIKEAISLTSSGAKRNGF